eukprot:3445025-Rhodomonas_salina.3
MASTDEGYGGTRARRSRFCCRPQTRSSSRRSTTISPRLSVTFPTFHIHIPHIPHSPTRYSPPFPPFPLTSSVYETLLHTPHAQHSPPSPPSSTFPTSLPRLEPFRLLQSPPSVPVSAFLAGCQAHTYPRSLSQQSNNTQRSPSPPRPDAGGLGPLGRVRNAGVSWSGDERSVAQGRVPAPAAEFHVGESGGCGAGDVLFLRKGAGRADGGGRGHGGVRQPLWYARRVGA